MWATNRVPAKVIGNGKQTVQELISSESLRRERLRESQFDLKSIVVDTELIRMLKKQGLSLNERPPKNTPVLLRSVANVSAGGTLEHCTARIHPDNVSMAECVARSFRLDTVGIDFIIPDIGKSWRECKSAIIEINGVPGFSTEKHAGMVLERKFVDGSNGRISVIMTLNCEASVQNLVFSEFGAVLEGVGYVDEDRCKLGTEVRGESSMQVTQKVNALLFDPACNALVDGLTTSEIEENGLPVDHCTVFLLSTRYEVPAHIKHIIENVNRLVAVGFCPGGVNLFLNTISLALYSDPCAIKE